MEVLFDYDVAFTYDGFEALRLFHSRPFHAYILASRLPDWSGVAVCREIRKTDPHSPIVFCSGAARAQDKELAMRAGASVYLAKPIEPTLLRSKLNALLGLAARESLQAQLAEQRAVQDELERRLSHVQSTLRHAHEYLQASIERSARTRAFKAFIAERGTPAHFDAWWPNVFQNAWVCKSGEAEAPKRPGATLGP